MDTVVAAPRSEEASDQERKRFARLQALLALRGGHVVHTLSNGTFLVAWRGWTRACNSLDELDAHARRVGALS